MPQIRIPPPPPMDNKDPGMWTGWYNAVHDAISRISNAISWANLDFTGSNITDVITRNHNDLTSLQGGSASERYHLTSTQASAIASFNATQWTDLTDSGESTLHYHASDRDSANFTGTNWTDLTDGGTTTLHKHTYSANATLDFPSIAANSTAELTMTVTGAVAGHTVKLGAPAAIETGLIWCGYVSATDTVTIRIHNMTGGAINPASASWRARVEV